MTFETACGVCLVLASERLEHPVYKLNLLEALVLGRDSRSVEQGFQCVSEI
jgi:hypothetical protein